MFPWHSPAHQHCRALATYKLGGGLCDLVVFGFCDLISGGSYHRDSPVCCALLTLVFSYGNRMAVPVRARSIMANDGVDDKHPHAHIGQYKGLTRHREALQRTGVERRLENTPGGLNIWSLSAPFS